MYLLDDEEFNKILNRGPKPKCKTREIMRAKIRRYTAITHSMAHKSNSNTRKIALHIKHEIYDHGTTHNYARHISQSSFNGVLAPTVVLAIPQWGVVDNYHEANVTHIRKQCHE